MPELPELVVIAERLSERLVGQTIPNVTVKNHLVVYGMTVDDFSESLVGSSFQSFHADGKFLVAGLDGNRHLVVNPMLTGKFRTEEGRGKDLKTDALRIDCDDLRLVYNDRRQMGRVYLIEGDDFSQVADFDGRGPSPLSQSLTLEEFRKRLRRRRGYIKNVLRNQRFVKGIGNAYADEILLYAGIQPFRKRSTLSEDEEEDLYKSMRRLLKKYIEILSERGLDDIGTEKRDFLMIHNKGGGVCPLCGGRISEVTTDRFKTSYCQTCQK